eukprot:Gb_37644 [translate_table: standard]
MASFDNAMASYALVHIAVSVRWMGVMAPTISILLFGDQFGDLIRIEYPASTRSGSILRAFIGSYKDASNKAVLSTARLGKQKLDESYSLGKTLKRSHIVALVETAVKSKDLPEKSNALYLVLTSQDVTVEGFCMKSCGFHANLLPSASNGKKLLPYVWVGNSATQCLGQSAWPFHQPICGPQTTPLMAPNEDVGIDWMIINIATVLEGAAKNPFNTGYFQGALLLLWRMYLPTQGYMEKGLNQATPISCWWMQR